MIRQEEISSHWNTENADFCGAPTLLGLKEAVFALRRDSQKAFRQGFEADCWTLEFSIPPAVGPQRISVVHNYGEKKIYVNGELYLTVDKKTGEEDENA